MSLDAGTPPADSAPPPPSSGGEPPPNEPTDQATATPDEGTPPSDDDLDFEEDVSSGGADPLELVEIEHEGRKYQVPRAYHEQRAPAPAIGTQPAQPTGPSQTSADSEAQEDAEDREYLAGARFALRQFEAITPEQRAEIRANDLGRAQELADEEAHLRRSIEEAQRRVDQREQQQTGRRREEALNEARRFVEDLPKVVIGGWDATKAKAVTDYGVSLGFSPQELGKIRDARMVSVLDKARRYDAAVAKRKRQQATENTPQPTSQPSRQRGAASSQPSHRDSTTSWMDKRNAQVNRKAGRS